MAFEQEINSNNPKHQEFAKLLDQDFKDRKLIENQIIKAKVVEILKSYIVCDAKAKSEAMIPISEFKEEELSKLKIGDTINCFLERIESMRSGEIVLSYQKAKSFAAWEKCLKAFENEEELTGIIQSKIKGGFICFFCGTTGFVSKKQIIKAREQRSFERLEEASGHKKFGSVNILNLV